MRTLRALTTLAGAAALILGLFGFAGTAIAAADSITPVERFDDPRGDWPKRGGQIVVARYGPYVIPGAGPGHHEEEGHFGEIRNNVRFSVPAPCTNCAITDIVPNLVFSDGTPASNETGAMLHHFVLFNPERADATCPRGLFGFQLGERVFASGNERSHAHFPRGYGYPNTSQNWRLIADLMNFEHEPQTVFIEAVVRYRPLSARIKPLTPLWFDIDNCRDSEYRIPSGYSDTHWDWTSTREGYVVGIGGHVHDIDHEQPGCHEHCPDKGGGIAVSAEIREGPASDYFGPLPPNPAPPTDLTGATLCRSEASYGTAFGLANGSMWHLDTMSFCGIRNGISRQVQPEQYPPGGRLPKPGYPLRRGQTVRLHSEYQNNGSPRDDVMGIMIGWLRETALRPSRQR
jgi:hypothetical protein